jgi:hypothetical protein
VEQKTSLFSPVYSILDGGDNLQFTIEASRLNSADYLSLHLFIPFYLFSAFNSEGGGGSRRRSALPTGRKFGRINQKGPNKKSTDGKVRGRI